MLVYIIKINKIREQDPLKQGLKPFDMYGLQYMLIFASKIH